MVYWLVLICTLLMVLTQAKKDGKKLVFLFEVTRHGARAPLSRKYSENFTVETEHLTPSGMRQHYLMGKYYRKKYIEDMKFLSPSYEQDEIFVASTYYARTIESARARMFGMYPPGSASNRLNKEEANSTFPPIHISDDLTVDSKDAIPSRYQPIAVMSNDEKHDTLFTTGSCPYLVSQYTKRHQNLTLWETYDDYFKPRLYEKLAEMMDVPYEAMDYQTAYLYGDALVSMEFEGVFSRDKFTDEEWMDIKRLQMPWCLSSFSPLGNRLMISKLFNPVLALIYSKLGRDHNPKLLKPYKGTEKYVLYSAHDTTVTAMFSFLHIEDLVPEYIDFATNIVFEFYELEKDEDGLTHHTVKVLYKNEPVKLKACKEIECRLSELREHFDRHGLSSEEVHRLCYMEV